MQYYLCIVLFSSFELLTDLKLFNALQPCNRAKKNSYFTVMQTLGVQSYSFVSAVIDYKIHLFSLCWSMCIIINTCICLCVCFNSFSNACFHKCSKGPDGGLWPGRTDSLQCSGPATACSHLEQGQKQLFLVTEKNVHQRSCGYTIG